MAWVHQWNDFSWLEQLNAKREYFCSFYVGVILRPGFIHGTRQVGSIKLPLSVIGAPLEMVNFGIYIFPQQILIFTQQFTEFCVSVSREQSLWVVKAHMEIDSHCWSLPSICCFLKLTDVRSSMDHWNYRTKEIS